ncbi:MAG: MBL fold metallo-hydrolase [Myxococcota bacterium]
MPAVRGAALALAALLLAPLALASDGGPVALAPDGAPAEAAPLYAAHADADGRFFTPWARADRSFLKFVRWRLSRNPYADVDAPPPRVVPNDGAYLRSARAGDAPSLTWVGHATYVVADGADVFLTDPHFGERALLPRRLVPPGLPVDAIPPDAFAVVSHNHYDHLDDDTVRALPASVGWYVPLGLADWFRERGRDDVTELDWWQTAHRGRFAITCLPSQHWSLRLGQPAGSTLWCAWLVDSGERRYFFAGDTGYFAGFAEFGRRFPGIDAALLPAGAYAPRWFMAYQHMDPQQSVRAFADLGARHLFAMHFGTFDLTDEPPGQGPVELRAAAREAGIDAARVHVPAVGERIALPPALDAGAPRAPAPEDAP